MPTRRHVTSLLAASLLSACAAPQTAPGPEAPGPVRPTGRFLDVNGKRVHVHVEGRGPALILLHGASGSTRDFTFSLVGRLAPRYRVIAFDRPGLGFSDPLHGRGESPAEQAAHLDAAARQLGVGRAVVLGHSYGAAVAMAWALYRPGRVAGIVTLAGVTMPWPGSLPPFYAMASTGLGGALISAFAGPETAQRALRFVFSPQRVPPGYADYVGVDLALRPDALRWSARQVNRLRPHLVAMAPRYPGLTIPVEILHGTADRAVSIDYHSRALAPVLPAGRLTELAGVGHMPHHSAPRAVLAAIDRAAARAGLRARA